MAEGPWLARSGREIHSHCDGNLPTVIPAREILGLKVGCFASA